MLLYYGMNERQANFYYIFMIFLLLDKSQHVLKKIVLDPIALI
jgi:hypothetical protein